MIWIDFWFSPKAMIMAKGLIHSKRGCCAVRAGGVPLRYGSLAGGRDELIRLVPEDQKIKCMIPAVYVLVKFNTHWGKDNKNWGNTQGVPSYAYVKWLWI